MSGASDNKEAPKDEMEVEAAAAPDAAKKDEQETDEAKEGQKMSPPAARGDAKNVSGSDAIKAAVKAGNINIHQEERELESCVCASLVFIRVAVASSMSGTHTHTHRHYTHRRR